MAPLSGLLLAAAALLVTACGGHACGGQCYPYQLEVVFRPGGTPAADRTAMLTCRGNPTVIRIGRVHPAHHAGPPGALAATVVTHSMTGKRPENLLACLRATPEVISAGFPD